MNQIGKAEQERHDQRLLQILREIDKRSRADERAIRGRRVAMGKMAARRLREGA